ncbi:DinB family protein [Risungbinella massiliensis]|uniref:DinB family protein n=1 Tax=Risungbinella massiliensis TaxID=1329796 RepID=UPI0005CC0D34|nr:DinB family protein [Risungbinella massiliensis]
MNQNEYEWVKQTREVLLNFCSELDQNDFTRQMDGFGFQSVREALVHIADCYNGWLGSFILLKTKNPKTSKEDLLQLGLDDIKVRFEYVDSLVNEVFEVFTDHMNEPVQKKIPWRQEGEMVSLTPGKLLTHTITHEFHHKGQIVAMLRQMGYEPPNTDVLGTKD